MKRREENERPTAADVAAADAVADAVAAGWAASGAISCFLTRSRARRPHLQILNLPTCVSPLESRETEVGSSSARARAQVFSRLPESVPSLARPRPLLFHLSGRLPAASSGARQPLDASAWTIPGRRDGRAQRQTAPDQQRELGTTPVDSFPPHGRVPRVILGSTRRRDAPGRTCAVDARERGGGGVSARARRRARGEEERVAETASLGPRPPSVAISVTPVRSGLAPMLTPPLHPYPHPQTIRTGNTTARQQHPRPAQKTAGRAVPKNEGDGPPLTHVQRAATTPTRTRHDAGRPRAQSQAPG